MGQPFVGEIRMFGGNFAPAGWMLCEGQTLPISENDVLFNLIGTTYGGDGQETFQLPNLQSRVPNHQGTGTGLSNYVLAQQGGTESVTLTVQQIPQHNHTATAVSGGAASTGTPANNTVLADCNTTTTATYVVPFNAANAQLALAPNTISQVGGNQPHENVQPFLCVNFIISLFGVYPSPN